MGRAFEFRKARKMKRWGKMAVTFTRIGKEISMAVKEGGPDPENIEIFMAMKNAKNIWENEVLINLKSKTTAEIINVRVTDEGKRALWSKSNDRNSYG